MRSIIGISSCQLVAGLRPPGCLLRPHPARSVTPVPRRPGFPNFMGRPGTMVAAWPGKRGRAVQIGESAQDGDDYKARRQLDPEVAQPMAPFQRERRGEGEDGRGQHHPREPLHPGVAQGFVGIRRAK